MKPPLNYAAMLRTVIDEARTGLAEGGIPIGAALYDGQGALLGRGHNRHVRQYRSLNIISAIKML